MLSAQKNASWKLRSSDSAVLEECPPSVARKPKYATRAPQFSCAWKLKFQKLPCLFQKSFTVLRYPDIGRGTCTRSHEEQFPAGKTHSDLPPLFQTLPKESPWPITMSLRYKDLRWICKHFCQTFSGNKLKLHIVIVIHIGSCTLLAPIWGSKVDNAITTLYPYLFSFYHRFTFSRVNFPPTFVQKITSVQMLHSTMPMNLYRSKCG